MAYNVILLLNMYLENCPDPSTKESCGQVFPFGMAAFIRCNNGAFYIVSCKAGKWEPSLPLCECN